MYCLVWKREKMDFTKEDFAAKDETDVYLFLKDSGFDDNVAQEFESESLNFKVVLRLRWHPQPVFLLNLFKLEGRGALALAQEHAE